MVEIIMYLFTNLGDSVVATLSSQWRTDDASKCLDGNVDTLCSSLEENNAFFMMEYPTLVTVTQVKVLARKGVHANRVKNVVVTVTDTKPTKGKPAAGELTFFVEIQLILFSILTTTSTTTIY